MVNSLLELDRQHIWHPFTQHKIALPPIPIVKAQGAFLFTEGGAKLLDGMSSWWLTTHGHCHPYLIQAISAQAQKLEHVMFAQFTHEPAVTLAERLLKLLPGHFSKIFYSDNGSTAIEVALKMAYQYWQHRGQNRTTFVALEHAYHGDTFGAMSASSRSAFTKPFWPLLFDVVRSSCPLDQNDRLTKEELVRLCLLDLENKLEQSKHAVAAVIIEPMIQGVGGMIVWPNGFLKGIATLCKKYDTLLIADEAFTGFGRTGPMFACEHEHVSPDIMCLAKGLTAGYLPLAVTAVKEEIFEAFMSDERAKAFFHGHSFTANPLGCAVANASLDLYESEHTLKKIQAIAEVFQTSLPQMAALPYVKEVRWLGPVGIIELKDDASDQGKRGYLADSGRRVCTQLLEKGLFLRPMGNVIPFTPPYCTTTDEVKQGLLFIKEVLLKLPQTGQ